MVWTGLGTQGGGREARAPDSAGSLQALRPITNGKTSRRDRPKGVLLDLKACEGPFDDENHAGEVQLKTA